MKFARVCIIGSPNAGKSTLINQILRQKISIVTHKMHTTRDNIVGIINENNVQIAFIDTPGVMKQARFKIEKSIISKALKELRNTDFVCILFDSTKNIENNILLNLEYYSKIPYKPVVALNKIDLLKNKSELLEKATYLKNEGFNNIFMISAQSGNGITALKNHFLNNAPTANIEYDDSLITDRSCRELAEDITREKLFLLFNKEIPYSLTVKTESWREQEKSIVIHQVIYALKRSQKRILLSQQGAMMKRACQSAKLDIKKLIGKKIHLFLFVKVRPKWTVG